MIKVSNNNKMAGKGENEQKMSDKNQIKKRVKGK